MKLFFGFVFTLVLILVLAPLTALGQIPILSELVGAGQKDLGVVVTQADADAALTKIGTEILPLPASTDPANDYRLEGKREVKLELTANELTASALNRPWKNYPVKNVQITIAPDGTIQGSAILIVAKALPYAMAMGYSEAQVREAMDKFHLPPFEIPVYISGKGNVLNDQVNVNASNIQIGAVSLPDSLVSQVNQEAESVLNDLVAKHSDSFHAEKLDFADGKMMFEGYLPEKEYVIQE